MPDDEERLQRLVRAAPLDWDLLWMVAEQQEVYPLVARALTSPRVVMDLPEDVVRQARMIRGSTACYNLAIHSELDRIGHALHLQGIPVAPLKGTHLAARLFGCLDARQVGDIDILVPEPQLGDARRCLAELGYAPAPGLSHGSIDHPFHGVPYVHKSPSLAFVVELHWGLSDPQQVTVDYEALWKRILGSAADEPLRPLPNEETLVFLSLHLAKHPTGVLRLLADVDRLVRQAAPTLDWSRVLAVADAWNVPWLLYFALRRAQLFFDTPLPEEVLRSLTPALWRRAAVVSLAGPRAILHPPVSRTLRSKQFHLAHCAMLQPLHRSLRAYLAYFFMGTNSAKPSRWPELGLVARLAHGSAWTGLVMASCSTAHLRRFLGPEAA